MASEPLHAISQAMRNERIRGNENCPTGQSIDPRSGKNGETSAAQGQSKARPHGHADGAMIGCAGQTACVRASVLYKQSDFGQSIVAVEARAAGGAV